MASEQERGGSRALLSGEAAPVFFENLLPAEARPARMPGVLRLAELRKALEQAGVLSASQLRRYYGATDAELAIFPFREVHLQPVHMRQLQVTCRFYSTDRSLLLRRPTDLAHMVGTTEARLHLGIPAEHWQAPRAVQGALSHLPDGQVMLGDQGTLAVEYDRGSYSYKKVIKKLTAFNLQGHRGVYWILPPRTDYGSASGRPSKKPNRKDQLQRRLLADPSYTRLGLSVVFLEIQWWDASDVTHLRTGHAQKPQPPEEQLKRARARQRAEALRRKSLT